MKKAYSAPQAVNFNEDITPSLGVPGALWGAMLMVARALARAYKGGIDLTAGTDKSVLLQERKI